MRGILILWCTCAGVSAFAETNTFQTTNYSALVRSNQMAAARDRQLAAAAQAWRQRSNAITQTAMVIEGKVWRHAAGNILIVRSGDDARARGREHDRFMRWASSPDFYMGKGDSAYYATNGMQIFMGEVALTHYTRASALADGDKVAVVAYPNGIGQIGGTRYRMFTTQAGAVREIASTKTMDELRRPESGMK